MWDERYCGDEYFVGTQVNDFLARHCAEIPSGEVLCLAEGKGRNTVFLAEPGYQSAAVDASAVSLQKAVKLASKRAVQITTIHADLADFADFDFGINRWRGIVSIFCH